jgi:hypothetical protein
MPAIRTSVRLSQACDDRARLRCDTPRCTVPRVRQPDTHTEKPAVGKAPRLTGSSPAAILRLDRRANKLADWTFHQVGREWFVLLRGSQEIAKHVIAGSSGAQLVDLRPGHRPHWTHRVHLAAPPSRQLKEFLRLLQTILVLCVRDGIDGAVALDFYQRPCVTDSDKLEYTPTGSLIRTIKYRVSQPDEITTAGLALCRSLSDMVTSHPWLRSATRILPVPGHDPRVSAASASVRMGHTLRRNLALGLTRVGTRSDEYRRSAKEMTPEERASLADGYAIDEDLSGCTVLIVDDVYHTGHTMAGVARAARGAGATTVLGVVAARARRRS